MKSHIEEWNEIKGRYEYMLECGFDKYLPKEALKYRIERIDELIKSQEINNNKINHFK